MPAGGGGGWVCPHITHTQPMRRHAGTRLCKLYRMMVVAPRSGAAAAAAWGRRAAARGSSSSGGGGAGGRSCLCVVDGTRVAPSFALCRTFLCMTLYIQATKGGSLAGDAVQTGWLCCRVPAAAGRGLASIQPHSLVQCWEPSWLPAPANHTTAAVHVPGIAASMHTVPHAGLTHSSVC